MLLNICTYTSLQKRCLEKIVKRKNKKSKKAKEELISLTNNPL